PGPGSGR
ncbi:hypothetical protein STRIP9103_08589, partial [Streptomyces ipomoeae 91-03]